MNLKKENILIVDDNYDMLALLQRHLKKLKYHTYKASSVNEAIEVLKYTTIDLLITDLNMPNINGIELIRYSEEHYPDMLKLVITGMPSIDNAVKVIKSGALDYLTKPFTADELYKAIQTSFERIKNTLEVSEISNFSNNENENNSVIIGRSAWFRDILETINRVKNNKVNVLIEGESGTGKELIARAIHEKGFLAKMPFVTVNCGGIPEGLIESELFGHIKGAFTGANESRIGLFQAASGGTIFLDEIGNAPMSLQTKLLRVLQEKEITKVGAVHAEKLDVRIIAATNNDLQQMVIDGTFREDLFYRINVVNIKTTPLRERKEDILPLVKNFLEKYSVEFNKPQIKIDDKVNEILLRYNWPGNIRELENIIQHLIIMSDELIEIKHVPGQLKYHIPEQYENFKSLKEYEKDQILRVLAAVDYNKTKAAKILQIDRKTLNLKIN